MTDYLITFRDANGEKHYEEVLSTTTSQAIHEINIKYGKCEILGVYVKV